MLARISGKDRERDPTVAAGEESTMATRAKKKMKVLKVVKKVT